MTKKYSAKSIIAIGVRLKDGTYKHVSFSARSSGGSVYYSSDPREQLALESHPKFGRLFRLEKEEIVSHEVVQSDDSLSESVPTSKGFVEVKVNDLVEAKDYLSDRFGVSRTKLRSSKSIIDAATANGIKFIGI